MRKIVTAAFLHLTLFHPCWKTVHSFVLPQSHFNHERKAKKIKEEVTLSPDTVEMSVKLFNFRGPVLGFLVIWLKKISLLIITLWWCRYLSLKAGGFLTWRNWEERTLSVTSSETLNYNLPAPAPKPSSYVSFSSLLPPSPTNSSLATLRPGLLIGQ